MSRHHVLWLLLVANWLLVSWPTMPAHLQQNEGMRDSPLTAIHKAQTSDGQRAGISGMLGLVHKLPVLAACVMAAMTAAVSKHCSRVYWQCCSPFCTTHQAAQTYTHARAALALCVVCAGMHSHKPLPCACDACAKGMATCSRPIRATCPPCVWLCAAQLAGVLTVSRLSCVAWHSTGLEAAGCAGCCVVCGGRMIC